jgi:hypothetical protein
MRLRAQAIGAQLDTRAGHTQQGLAVILTLPSHFLPNS